MHKKVKIHKKTYKIKNRLRNIYTLIILITVIFSNYISCRADYVIDENNNKRNIPDSYICYKYIDYFEGYGILDSPEDIFVSDAGFLYITDSGKNSILMLDKEGKLIRIYGGETEETALNKPMSVFVDEDGDLYVADTGNERIVHISSSGIYIEEFIKPSDSFLNSISNFKFTPEKILINKTGYIYFIRGQDIMIIDSDNTFKGYLARSKSQFSVLDFLERIFTSKKAERNSQNVGKTPPFLNFTISDEGFIYAVAAETARNQILKMNWVGTNLYQEGVYGERYYDSSSEDNPVKNPVFNDIAVDRNGIVYLIEKFSNRIYRYNQQGICLTVFGGTGYIRGKFNAVTAIDVDDNGNVYILDKGVKTLQILTPSKFTSYVNEAEYYYNLGEYEKSAEIWKKTLIYCGSYPAMYKGIARAFYMKGDYDKAMDNFKMAGDIEGYSQAFIKKRFAFVTNNFGLTVLFSILFMTVFVFAVIALREYTEQYIRR